MGKTRFGVFWKGLLEELNGVKYPLSRQLLHHLIAHFQLQLAVNRRYFFLMTLSVNETIFEYRSHDVVKQLVILQFTIVKDKDAALGTDLENRDDLRVEDMSAATGLTVDSNC